MKKVVGVIVGGLVSALIFQTEARAATIVQSAVVSLSGFSDGPSSLPATDVLTFSKFDGILGILDSVTFTFDLAGGFSASIFAPTGG